MSSPSASSANDRSSIARLDWRPDELGFTRAFLLASVAVSMLAGGLAALTNRFVAAPPPLPMTVHLVEPTAALPPSIQTEAEAPDAAIAATPLPIVQSVPSVPEPLAPTVPEPVAPPATPAPDLAPAPVSDAVPDLMFEVTPELAPPITAPSRTALLPPRPVAHPAPRRPARPQSSPTSTRASATEQNSRSPATERAVSPAVPPPTDKDNTSGLGPYRTALHRQIERNMLNNHEVQRLGISGTTVIEASIAPDGRVLLARITHGSGNRAIDQAALAAVQRGGFAAFGAHMPLESITISVPIGVEAE